MVLPVTIELTTLALPRLENDCEAVS